MDIENKISYTDFIDKFNTFYSEDRAFIFLAFEEEGYYSASEKQKIFAALKDKQKQNLYNTISVDARNAYVTSIGDQSKDFLKKMRSLGSNQAREMEIELLNAGNCTYDWDVEQIKDMFLSNDGSLSDKVHASHDYNPFGEPIFTVSVQGKNTKNPGKVNVNYSNIEAHHMLNVHNNPEFAADGRVFQFVNKNEHKMAHAGNFKNETFSYFDGEYYFGIEFEGTSVKNGVFDAGGFKGTGSVYKLDPNTNELVEIAQDSSEYKKILSSGNGEALSARKYPPIQKSKIFPSDSEFSKIFDGAEMSDLDKFRAKIGVAEYRQLGIDVDASHIKNNPEMTSYLQSLCDDPSNLSKTTISFNEEGLINEVALKLDDSSDEIKLVSSGLDSSASKLTVTAAEYKRMTALPDDVASVSMSIRYGDTYKNMSKIDQLKLRKIDSLFAEKSLYITLDGFDDATRSKILGTLDELSINPEKIDDIAFCFNKDGKIIDIDTPEHFAAHPKGEFVADFSELRNAPSDIDIMRKYHGLGGKVNKISDLDMQKIRLGIARYEKVGNTTIENILSMAAQQENETGFVLREYLLGIADDSSVMKSTKFHFDGEGKLTGISTSKKPFSGVSEFELTMEEVSKLPSDGTMRNITSKYDNLDDATKFKLKHSLAEGNTDDFLEIISKKCPENVDDLRKLISMSDDKLDDVADLLNKSKGNIGEAVEMAERSGSIKKAVNVIENTGDDVTESLKLARHFDDIDDAVRFAADAGEDIKGVNKLLNLTSGDTAGTSRLIQQFDGHIDDVEKAVTKFGNSADDVSKVFKAANNNRDEVMKVMKYVDNADEAVTIFNKLGKSIDDSSLIKKYKFCVDDPEVLEIYRKAEYKIALGADPKKVFVGELFEETEKRFKVSHKILAKDLKDLRLDDFLEFARNDSALTNVDNVADVLYASKGKLSLTKAIRSVDAWGTAFQIYDTVSFISKTAHSLASGEMSARDAGEASSKYILSNSLSWLGSEAAAALTGAALAMVGVTGPIGIAAVVVFSIGAGIAGSKLGDWLVDTQYQNAYDAAWKLMDYFGHKKEGFHLIDGTDKSDIMNFSDGRIYVASTSLGYDVECPMVIDGYEGDDVIVGYNFGDTLNGQSGNDTIHGGTGADTISGGDGNDSLYGLDGNDNISGGNGFDVIYGGKGSDTIHGDNDEDVIHGGDDNDYISGGASGDELYGEEGDDTIYGEAGDDKVKGGNGNDTLYGDDSEGLNCGADIIDGGDGDDYIDAGDGEDGVLGGNGNDTIYGDAKRWINTHVGLADIISGGNGNDTIYGGAGDDEIEGEAGNDNLYGGYGKDNIDGGLGSDKIFGGDDADNIFADAGDDKVYGGKGDDTIHGGYGNDFLYGDDGRDTYIFEKELYGNASNKGNVNDHDRVFDPYGTNTIVFSGTPSDLDKFNSIIRFDKSDDGKNLIISSRQTHASMELVDYYVNNNFNFKFGDSYAAYHVNDDMKLVSGTGKKPSGNSGRGSIGHLIDDSKTVIIKDYKTASQAQPPRDPLVIDINGDGVHTTGVVDGVHFDIDNNGFAEQTEWIDRIDGFLVYDRDGDGRITNGSELFSDQVYLPDGTRLKDGFAVLETFDKDKNGFVSGKELDNIMVWIDKDHDGKSFVFEEGMEINPEDQELFTMDELGITSISTQFTIPEEDEDKPIKNLIADVIKDGDLTTISEHWFEADTADTLELKTEGVDDDLTSFGSLHSITYFVEQLGDTYVSELVDRFNESEDYAEKRLITRKLLYHISGAENIDRNSRGYYIDARDLHVLETIMGSGSFVGVGNSNNPNTNAAAILKEMYNKFEELYFNILNQNSNASDVLNLICEVVDDAGKVALNIDDLNEALDSISDTDGKADNLVCSVCSYLKAYDNAHNTNYLSQFINAHPDANETFNRYINASFMLGTGMDDKLEGTNANEVFWGEDGNDTINAANGKDTIYGGEGNDTLNSGAGNDIAYGGAGNDIINGNSGNDVLYGEEGNDTINGETGDDVIYAGAGDDVIDGGEGSDVLYGEEDNDSLNGGTGDDKLYGGVGDDKYYFNTDHGNDTVYDSEGLSTLVFGDEISADAYRMNIDISSGISLVNDETGETIEIPDFINVPELYDFEFEDGSGMIGGGETRQVIEGTDGDDTITAGDGFNIIRGGEGNDNITGGDNLNFIYGGDGDDTITGGNGTNIIRGEDGNDIITDGSGSSYIDGGNGNDVIHAGDGNDIIIGGFGADQLYGEDGDDVIAGNAGDDEIDGGNGDDTVYADNGSDTVHGGDGNDSLFGGNGDDVLYGDEGDDYLEAGNGEDTLYGGEGNDVFVGGTGVNNMYGDEGDDIFHGGNGINNMYGGEGDDTFTGGELADYIEGGNGNDTMNGGNGENRMFGNDGDDQIYGGNDDDYIEGGEGDDKLYGGNGINTIYGGTGNDKIFDGDENSFLYGGDGDDEIRAGGGSDVLDGGAGNDYLQSDHGGDTYVFGVGYDVDTIHASADLNTIVIHGYTAEDMHNTRMPNNALVVDFGTDTGDKLVIEGFFNFNSNREFNFVFDDDTVLEQDQIEAVNAPIYGTSDDDTLFAVDSTGWNIIGGEGNDKLNGGEGNDILDGGIGNDVLNGGTGANTYVYGVGYDIDTIEASADSCTIIIHGYNVADMDSVRETDKSLAISFGAETGDKLIIKSFYEDYLDRNYQFVFDDGAVLGKSDINAKAAPIIGTDGDDNIYATNGDDIIDGGAGNDSLAGSNGEDTYIFGKGYDHDTINEWGIDHSFVELKDINSDGVTISNQWGSNLIVSVNDTEDVLTVSNFKWGQASYTFKFADGAEGYVDKNTWELVLTKQPDIVEDIEQAGAELLNEIYSNEGIDSDLISNNDNTVIDNITNSVNVSDENVDIADLTDIQAMILAENMSAFGDDSLISTGLNIGDITSDTSALDQLLVSSSIQ